MSRKKLILTLVCLCIAASLLFAVSVNALQPITCTGNYMGESTYTHRYGFLNLKSHTVYSYSHSVDRVWSGHVYQEIGHTSVNCGHPELNFNTSPGCIGTVVGEG